MTVAQRADLTFKHNLEQGRHGWLRLTPAYSVKVVQDILESIERPRFVLDPFSGTGTTGLVCSERGISCDLVEINPFLVWLIKTKLYNYSLEELEKASNLADRVVAQVRQNAPSSPLWLPPISHIERWWTPQRLATLAKLFGQLQSYHKQSEEAPYLNILLVAFCQVAINWSNAAFNHQSMSFKTVNTVQLSLFEQNEQELITENFFERVRQIIASTKCSFPEENNKGNVYNGNSCDVKSVVLNQYDCVITSPPYPNRMSYIRELRPYMYWLGFLHEAREAGELDWEAIGGTWGIATSRLAGWKSDGPTVEYPDFNNVIQTINRQSPLLANYVHKYFLDIATHISNLRQALVSGAKVFYVVGNSKFYDTIVPVEKIYASLLHQYGFENIKIELIRKRNSKKELHEFVVAAEWK